MRYVIAFVFCMFMGVTGISLGLGTAIPAINHIAKPIVCPDGEMAVETSSRRSQTHSRRTVTTAAWSCVDSSGEEVPISRVTLSLIAGSFYGLVLFLPVALLMAVRGGSKRSAAPRPMGPPPGQF